MNENEQRKRSGDQELFEELRDREWRRGCRCSAPCRRSRFRSSCLLCRSPGDSRSCRRPNERRSESGELEGERVRFAAAPDEDLLCSLAFDTAFALGFAAVVLLGALLSDSRCCAPDALAATTRAATFAASARRSGFEVLCVSDDCEEKPEGAAAAALFAEPLLLVESSV